MSRENYYFIKDGILWHTSENDGYRYLRRGAESITLPLCRIEEAEIKYPKELEKAENLDDNN